MENKRFVLYHALKCGVTAPLAPFGWACNAGKFGSSDLTTKI